MKNIPIKNIYYLLCYAWDKLEEGEKVKVADDSYSNAIDLFTRVLINGTDHLLVRGLDRDYVNITEGYNGIKGKINFAESLKRDSFNQGRAICDFDEFEKDILQNQILKYTFLKLTKFSDLDRKLIPSVWAHYHLLSGISDLEVNKQHFSQVKIHRNNSFYKFLLNICEMIFDAIVIAKDKGDLQFTHFLEDDKAMARLFESFVRNFYKKNQSIFKVKSEVINWNARPINNADISLLPQMRTDITLENENRKIIIDTKYYSKTTTSFYDKESFHSGNLYQLFSYLKNVEANYQDQVNINSEGILLYPRVNDLYDHEYQMGTHKLRVLTIDLSNDWELIDESMRDILL